MQQDKKAAKPTKKEALEKLRHYCAYRERCHQEVRSKLLGIGIAGEALEEIIAQLIIENYLNEQRYACLYAQGKFRLKKWGRLKIENNLRKKGVSDHCIAKGLAEIDEAEYLATLKRLLEKKLKTTGIENHYQKNDKAARFAVGRGFEPDLVWRILKKS